jgi:hypothetical protein
MSIGDVWFAGREHVVGSAVDLLSMMQSFVGQVVLVVLWFHVPVLVDLESRYMPHVIICAEMKQRCRRE